MWRSRAKTRQEESSEPRSIVLLVATCACVSEDLG